MDSFAKMSTHCLYKTLVFSVMLWFSMPSQAQFALLPPIGACEDLAAWATSSPLEGKGRLEIGYRMNYARTDMSTKCLAGEVGIGRLGAVLFGYQSFGDVRYNEQQAVMAYRMRVADRLRIGVGGRFCTIGTTDTRFVRPRYLAAWVNGLWIVDSRVLLAVSLGTQPWVQEQRWMYQIEAVYRPTLRVATHLGLLDEGRARVYGKVCYALSQHIEVMAGVASNPMVADIGLAVKWERLRLVVSSGYHSLLGFTPQVNLSLCI